MTEDELFMKARLFLYKAAGENIGFDIKPVEDLKPTEDPEKQRA